MVVERPLYNFEELEVYKVAREFRKKMYSIANQLPAVEKFNLVSQIKRASVSVTNNIAEGHGRFHYQENIQFLRQARGSLEELIDDLNVCLDEKYCSEEITASLKEDAFVLLKKINSYVAYLRAKKKQDEI
ncbi:MAG: four helix bundle protein [Ignavibacteriales bacterium]|nr:four helix bundle protein [Ignavibacteriales bacterium]